MKELRYLLFFGIFTTSALAQSPFIPLNADYYHLIDRYEIRRGQWTNGFHSTVKPYNRFSVVRLADSVVADRTLPLSTTDAFNLRYFYDDSWEQLTPGNDSIARTLYQNVTDSTGRPRLAPGDALRPLGAFYRKKADAYSTQTDDFDLHVSPAVYVGVGQDAATPGGLFVNTRGLEVRGSIRQRLGFYTYFADNQVTYPRYIREYGQFYSPFGNGIAAPGEYAVKRSGQNGADFLSARGYITFNFLKIINAQFGHDRNFFGNGYRSLLLSDNAPSSTFLKLTTRFGKRFLYTNLYSELQNTQIKVGLNDPNVPKYMAVHHLSVNLTPNVNLGVFEAIVFSRDRLEFAYLNPIIFYRYAEASRGSNADNAFIGLDLKVNFRRQFLAYGQLMIDELLVGELFSNPGSWVNKNALQLGVKYIDALGVPNLDLQVEYNVARPYTYSHRSGQTNYAHYSQPLAHPLGANFREVLGIVRFQRRQLSVFGTFGVMLRSTDLPFRNYGGFMLLNYEDRIRSEGNFIGQGRQTYITTADLRASYMVRHNIFLDARYLWRFQDSQFRPNSYTTSLGSIALRWNVPYRSQTY